MTLKPVIRNKTAYLSRVVQDWHRNSERLGFHATAIDIDLVGVCHRGFCRRDLYIIEATRDPNKHTNIIKGMSQRLETPSFCVLHDAKVPKKTTAIWLPPDMSELPDVVDGGEALEGLLIKIRQIHRDRCHA